MRRRGRGAERVSADRIWLKQILVNLPRNALEVVADRSVRRVTIDAERSVADAISLRIADTGAGIDPSLDDALFTPFASTKPDGPNPGFAIAIDIAREFGGELALAPSNDGATRVLSLRRA